MTALQSDVFLKWNCSAQRKQLPKSTANSSVSNSICVFFQIKLFL